MTVNHNPGNQQFITTRQGHMAELAYTRPEESVIDFAHTFVDEGLRGQGVADELARAGLEYARNENLKVRTSCSFMAEFVKRHHEEYANILA